MEGIQKFSQGNQIFNQLYDSKTGVLNKSIWKLSGKYKIIVSSRKNNYKLYISDYTGYKVELDITKELMPQIGQFLKTRTNIDESKTLYGGYSDSGYSWHIPFYISSEDDNLPNFFCIYKTDNKKSTDIKVENLRNLFTYSSPIDVVDLDKVFVTNIFKTIDNLKSNEMYLDMPVQLYWGGDNKLSSIVLHGYDYEECCVSKKEINIKEYVQNRINKSKESAISKGLTDSTYDEIEKILLRFKNSTNNSAAVLSSASAAHNPTNQGTNISETFEIDENNSSIPFEDISEYDDFAFFNDLILDLFDENHMIFPRFINIEFEFDYVRPADYVCDFQNFFGYLANATEKKPLVDTFKVLKVYRHTKNTNTTDFTEINQLNPDSYNINWRNELVNVLHLQDIKEQEYMCMVKPQRITPNDRITIFEDGEIVLDFRIDPENIKSKRYETMVNIANRINYLSNDYIKVTVSRDLIWLFKCVSLFTIDFYSGTHYSHNYQIIQQPENITLNDVELVDAEIEDFPNLPQILFINGDEYHITRIFKYNRNTIFRLDNNPQLRYMTEAFVYEKFPEEILYFTPVTFLNKYNSIETRPLFDAAQYAEEIADVVPHYVGTVPSPYQYSKANQVSIENNSETIFISGNTNFVNIHTLNYDEIFGRKNGCLVKYPSYFLIKGQCPDYISYDFRSNRYFEKEPKLRSILKRINNNTCECVFLGTKYSLDIKYEGYRLCTYIDLKAENYNEAEYYAIVNHVKKTIDIVINKPLEFTGIDAIDLSIFGNINGEFVFAESHNDIFSVTGFKFCDEISDYDLSLSNYGSRIVQDKFLVLRNRMYVEPFSNMFENGSDILGHYYAEFPKNETDDTVGLVYTITFKNATNITPDSFLCDDIIVRIMYTVLDDMWEATDLYHQYDESGFYDTYQSFRITVDDSRQLHRKYIHDLENFPETIKLRRYLKDEVADVNVDIATQEISLKSQYFSFDYKPDGSKSIFTFPEFYNSSLLSNVNQFEELINPHYDGATYDEEFRSMLDNQNNTYSITTFSTNKIWQLIAVMSNNLTSPHMTAEQLQNYVSTFNFDIFHNYVNNNILHIFGTDESLNVKIIDIDVNKDRYSKNLYRYSTYYKNYFTEYDNMLQFQFVRETQVLKLFTLFIENYGYYLDETYQESLSYNIGGTGIWGEVHNLVSSLYTGEDLVLRTTFDNHINVGKELIGKLYYDKMIINNENNRYIKKLSMNVRNYIKESYPKYILDNFYDVESVLVDGGKVDFDYNKYDYSLQIYGVETGSEMIVNLKRR